MKHDFAARPLIAATALALVLAGCSSSSSEGPSAFQKIGNVIAFQSTTPPPAPERLPEEEQNDFVCPQVIIEEGGAAIRAQGGPDSSSLRHQTAILNVARECTPRPDGSFALKIGVEGRVVIGPAGSPGSYFSSLNMRVLRGTSVVAQRTARVGAQIPSGQGGASFTHVEEGIQVPAGTSDAEIIVRLGGPAPVASNRRRR